MEDKTIKTIIEAMALQIDRLKGDLFCKDYEIEKLKEENAKLQKTVKLLAQEVAKDG